MAHHIQAMVMTPEVAVKIQDLHPDLSSVPMRQDFVLLPVDETIVATISGPSASSNFGGFQLLCEGFHDSLRELSRFGPLAYIETDYFGGVGGQGGAVYANREILMSPEWRSSGSINRALKQLGVKPRLVGDRFAALGLMEYRSKDALIEAALAARDST